MKAKKGDTITVSSRTLGGSKRQGTIVNVEGSLGGPPYEVLWQGDDHPHLVFPGDDATITAGSR